MRLSYDLPSRAARLLFTLALAIAWSGYAGDSTRAADPPPAAAPQPAPPRDPAGDLKRLCASIAAADQDLPKDSFDPEALVARIGRDPDKLFAWVRDHTAWVPYQGTLRGPAGVLMDRVGNSLDRSLLLARLLTIAGERVRLARTTLGPEEAQKVLDKLPKAVPARDGGGGADDAVPDDMEAVAADYMNKFGLDGRAIGQTFARMQVEASRVAEQAVQRTGGHTQRLSKLIGAAGGQAGGQDKSAAGADLAAARDHWWVQRAAGDRWLDLDASAGDAGAAAPPRPAKTFAPEADGRFKLGDELAHLVRIRVVREQWRRGKLAQAPVLQYALRPADVIGQHVTLSHMPLDWPGDDSAQKMDAAARLKSITVDQHEWIPVLQIGRQRVMQSSFTDTGEVDTTPNADPMARLGKSLKAINRVADLLGTLGDDPAAGGGGKADAGQLTAVWVEYEVAAPGHKPLVSRREVFDLIGPAARAAGVSAAPALDDARRLERGLALLDTIQILLVPCRLSPEFVGHLGATATLANEAPLGDLARRVTSGQRVETSKLFQQLTPLPGPLYDLALARLDWSRNAGRLYADHANVLTYRNGMRPEKDGRTRVCGGFDIVENGLAVLGASPAEAFAVRLEQGVLDTNAEALLVGACGGLENAAERFDALAGAGAEGWAVVRSADDPRWRAAAEVPADLRARVNTDLAAGYIAVVPLGAAAGAGAGATPAGAPRTCWWRIDPATGQTLGMGYGGAGAAMVEYVMIVVSVALCGAIAFADPRGLTVQDAIVCAAVVGGGGAGLLMGGITGLKLGALLVALFAGTGFWLNQGDWLQRPIF